ncbi:MAG: hypothetical protein PVH35_04310, partial [Syntrophobacterales bacterium]
QNRGTAPGAFRANDRRYSATAMMAGGLTTEYIEITDLRCEMCCNTLLSFLTSHITYHTSHIIESLVPFVDILSPR